MAVVKEKPQKERNQIKDGKQIKERKQIKEGVKKYKYITRSFIFWLYNSNSNTSMSLLSKIYPFFEIIFKIFLDSVVSNSLCVLFFGLIYIIISLNKPINYDITYKDKLKIVDTSLIFSAKNQFLYDVHVPYPVSFTDIESMIILSQQVLVVVLLMYYKLHFFVEVHRKYFH